MSELEQLVRDVELLESHKVSGYEWDCECNAVWTHDFPRLPDGTICPHYDDLGVVSRAEVLRLIRKAAERGAQASFVPHS